MKSNTTDKDGIQKPFDYSNASSVLNLCWENTMPFDFF